MIRVSVKQKNNQGSESSKAFLFQYTGQITRREDASRPAPFSFEQKQALEMSRSHRPLNVRICEGVLFLRIECGT